MNFADAVRSVLSQYVGFSGRARRSEYWWFALFTAMVAIVAAVLDVALHTPAAVLVLDLALLLPSLAVTVRRLHDTGRSGWWILIEFIPIVGAIVLLVFCCQDSHLGQNKYGPSPKYPGAPQAGPYPPYPPYPQPYPGSA